MQRADIEKGKRKAARIAKILFPNSMVGPNMTESELLDLRAKYVNNHRDGNSCSCQMCRNPRTSNIYKGKGKLTMQERRKFQTAE